MKNHSYCILLTVLLSLSAAADDIRGADHVLCSTLQASICLPDHGCTTVPPAELNIPRFIEVDVKARTLSTTAASGENRQTRVTSIERLDGQLVIQGYDSGRAFSLLIPELSGLASFASAGEERGVVVFAACTPIAER